MAAGSDIVKDWIFLCDTFGEAHTAAEREALIRCAKMAIGYLDDNVTPANEISRVAHARCYREERAVYAAATRGMDIYTLKGFKETYDPVRIFTGFVLSDRAKRRNATARQ